MNAKLTAGSKTVVDLFRERVDSAADTIAFRFPEEGSWGALSWGQAAARVRKWALGLRALGIDSGDRVAIASLTRVEWILADVAILAAGAATTTIYPSSSVEERSYILKDSKSRIVFAENQEQVDRLLQAKDDLPDLIKIVTFEATKADDLVIGIEQLEDLGEEKDKAEPELYDRIAEELDPSALATLIYTSGTTGTPKGVELLHDGWVAMAEAVRDENLIGADEHQFLWLPLSHSFGKALICIQLAVGFETSVDGDLTKIIENLAIVRPTFMAAAPRIFEKVYNKISTGAAAAGGAKYTIFRWAVKTARAVTQERQNGREPGFLLNLQHGLAHKLVYSKLHARFGGKLRYFISGSAPLNREIAEFFEGAGLPILEGYGLTESCAASFCNRPGKNRLGTVGPPIGVEIKVADETGEILLRGRSIMRGYHNREDATSETLKDGWLYTGDKGELDEAGHLKITGRIKHLIKTSGGKYVAPAKLEARLKVLCPYLAQVIVHGDTRNYCSALITLDPESIGEWAGQQGLTTDYKALTTHAKVHELIQAALDELNTDLASYETVKKFAVLPEDLTIENGFLTPSMKVRRNKVEEHYKALLDGMYEGAMADI